jgi:hypothetical protein
LDDLFEWAVNLNYYHPEVKDISYRKVPKGYHPLRYQTNAYDKCTKSQSIFTQDEWKFMERYRWLRHVPDFLKPGDLFCVMNKVEAQKEAEQKLQNFMLENDRIRCPDVSTLNALIPFVKRMVRLYPQLKDEAKDQLSSVQIRNGVYQYETQSSVVKHIKSVLDFNPCAISLR